MKEEIRKILLEGGACAVGFAKAAEVDPGMGTFRGVAVTRKARRNGIYAQPSSRYAAIRACLLEEPTPSFPLPSIIAETPPQTLL